MVASRHLDWLRQADADLRLARHAREGAAHDWVCFAAQQAAEKALKAVLMSRGADAWGNTVTALLGVVTDFVPKAKLEVVMGQHGDRASRRRHGG